MQIGICMEHKKIPKWLVADAETTKSQNLHSLHFFYEKKLIFTTRVVDNQKFIYEKLSEKKTHNTRYSFLCLSNERSTAGLIEG